MSKYNDAALTLRRQAVKYEALMAAAAVLDEIGSFEQAAAAQQSAASTAEAAVDSARAELVSLTEEIAQAKIKFADLVNESDSIFAKAVFDANESAHAVQAKADADAAQIKQNAEKLANSLVADATRKANSIISEHAGLMVEIAKLQESARTAEAEASVAEAGLDKVKESHAAWIAQLAGR